MRKVTIYTKDDCSNCEKVKAFYDNNEVEYEPINVYHEEEALNYVKSLGFSSLPVVVIEGYEPFSGFNLQKLAQAF